MADKMWEILRFLKPPQQGEAEGVSDEAAEQKSRIDTRLTEALQVVEKAADIASRNEENASSERAYLTNLVEASRVARKNATEHDPVPSEVLEEPPLADAGDAPADSNEAPNVETSEPPVPQPQPEAVPPSAKAAPREPDRPTVAGLLRAKESILERHDRKTSSLLERSPNGEAPSSTESAARPSLGDTARNLKNIPIGDITPNPFQPRLKVDEGELEELAESIREVGVLQPILVRQTLSGYQLIAGERRLRAARKVGHATIPALVTEVDAFSQQLFALIENLQRKNLSAVEEARCLQDIVDRSGWSQVELAKRLGRSQASVANKIRLLKLDSDVQELVMTGKLGERQARSLLGLPTADQKDLAQRAVEEDLSARDLEVLTESRIGREKVTKKSRAVSRRESSPVATGETGELLQDLSALINKYRNRGIPAQWKVRELAQNALVVEIIVDLKDKEPKA